MTTRNSLVCATVALALCAQIAFAQTPPPAPTLVAPANGASLAQPVTLSWNPVVDPDGPIGSYLWEVATTASFTTIVADGGTSMLHPDVPAATHEQISGLANGTYFWHVKATQLVNGDVFESSFSTTRSFTITGLGAAPGTPSFTAPANNGSFHPFEFFQIHWTAVPGAHHYLLEADDEPTFAYPQPLTTDLIQFATSFRAGWGNQLPDIYYRVVAVSADNVRGLPSAPLHLHIINGAPVPPAPTLLSPANGASVSLPFTFDWTDTLNPESPSYDLDVDTDPNFDGEFGVLLIQNINRSDYMLGEFLDPGTYFWRIRATHGNAFGPWSAGRSFTLTAAPATPGLRVFLINPVPFTVYGGNSTQARVSLNMPAPPGGVVVKVASDLPHAQTPTSVTVLEGKTDATVTPITSIPVGADAVGTVRAAYPGHVEQNSLGISPIFLGISFNNESVVGGNPLTGTITLLNPAPSGGLTVTLISGNTGIVSIPPSVFIPAGATGATFNVTTSAVTTPELVSIDSGTPLENFRAARHFLRVMPAGSPAPLVTVSSLVLSANAVPAGGTVTGTVILSGPAPAGGAFILLSGSLEGQTMVPFSMTIPAGNTSGTFPINTPEVLFTEYAVIRATSGMTGDIQSKLLEVDPGSNDPKLFAIGAFPLAVSGGNNSVGTVALVVPAPAGGAVVALSSDDTSVIQVPPTVTIAAGNSTNSFAIQTSNVFFPMSIRVSATVGGVTRDVFVDVNPAPGTPPAVQSVVVAPDTVPGGTNTTGTVTLAFAPTSETAFVMLSTSNPNVALPPAVVGVPVGQTSANFTIHTSPVGATTHVTMGAFFGGAFQFDDLFVTPACCAADFNGSHTITTADVAAFVARLLSGASCSPPACCLGDMNFDGTVNGRDIPPFVSQVSSATTCP